MRTVFHGKRITGLLGVLPEKLVHFEDEVSNYTFPAKQTLRLQKVMGYNTRRIVKEETATSDLCIAGLSYILNKSLIKKEDIGGLVVTTTVPDHFIPPVSNIVQGHFHLDKDVMCLDISQGCVGFLVGLFEALMLLNHLPDGKKVVVMAADVLSKKTSKQDRNSYPLVGDGAGIAIVENDTSAPDINCIMYNDGSRGNALIIPAGGSRILCNAETAIKRDINNDGNLRALDDLCMNGSEVFTFVQTCVPPLIDEVMEYSGTSKDEIDWFLFHQPNKFMLKKLAEKIGIPYEKVPMELVENFGNTSGACIPINVAFTFGEKMISNKYRCCLSAFGSGLAWGAITMTLGDMKFCEMLISDC